MVVTERIALHAATRPSAVAVRLAERELTYQQLHCRSHELAARLRQRGVGPESVVGVRLAPSLELIVCLLAVLKAGGCYLPIDPSLPAARAQFQIDDSSMELLICGSTDADLRHGNRLHVDEPEVAAVLGRDPPEVPELPLPLPAQAAYIIYTSGTTGQPKGCVVSHDNVLGLLDAAQPFFQFGADDIWTLFHSFAFDFSVWEIWGALSHGGRLIIVPEPTRRDPAAVVQLLLRERVTVLNQTPSAFAQLLQVQRFDAVAAGSLRYVIFGGEALSIGRLARWLQQHGDRQPQLVNMYGITETTVHVTLRAVSCADLAWSERSTIGRPLPGAEIHLLDADLQPVAPGEIGEIVVAGWGVSRGYLNRDALTAERFIANPFGPGRLYRSGDLGQQLPSGEIVYLGRSDQQVKWRGYRIELAEIEAVLLEHPAVEQARVLCRDAHHDQAMLVAYVVADQGFRGDEPSLWPLLRAALAERLPPYMLPSAWVALEHIPLTVNGKLDCQALLDLGLPHDSTGQSSEVDQPRNDREALLMAQWAELLGLSRVGRHDDFFELGGHSLLAMQLQARLAQQGISMAVASVFASPKLSDLARALQQPIDVIGSQGESCRELDLPSEAIARVHAAIPGGASNIEDMAPLTPLQEGVLLQHRLSCERSGSRDPYLGAVLWRVRGHDRLRAFGAAWQSLVERHPILRTAFVWQGLAEPLQVVCRQVDVAWQEIELDTAKGPLDQQLLDVARNLTLDVGRAPLLRLLVAADVEPDQWLVVRLTHHLVTDHISEAVLRSELQAHLQGQAEQLPVVVPYRCVVDQCRQSQLDAAAETYFKQLLADLSAPALPLAHHGNAARPSTSASASEPGLDQPRRGHLGARSYLQLQAAAAHVGVTVATLAHLAWAVVLARCSGQDDVVFGTVLLGRLQSGADLSRVVGPCINTLPLRLCLMDVGLAEAARQIQHQLNTLIRFEHTPLELAQRCSGLAAPLVQVLINYRSSAEATLASDAMSGQLSGVRELTRLDERTHLPVVLSLDANSDDLHLSLQAQEPSVAQRLLAHMITTLERLGDALLQTPELPLSRLSSLPDDERHLLLTTCNDTHSPYPANAPIEDLFAAQVQRDSAAIAVETIDETLSYGELNASANALAERLQAQGVGPETIVAVILERSSAMVVAVLGVLKAGGAYLPLDPATPTARRDALLLQARCSHCLDRPEQVWRASAQVRLIHVAAAPRSPHPHARYSPQPRDPGRRLAYINFTSGSTGIPKAVAIEHRSVNRLVINNPPLRFGPGERVLQLAPLAFDAATLEIWGALLNGGTLVVHPPGQPSPAQLALFVQQRRITTLWLTAGLFHLMVEEACEVLQQVPQLVAGGDRLNPDLVRRVLSGLPKGHRLINGYGPTEATTFTCCFAMERSTSIGGSVPIGRPISNTSVFVLDAQQQPVPVGVVGELYIGGDGLAREYLHDPERTAAQFVMVDGLCSDATTAVGSVPQRLYRSGDLVSWSADGVLLFHGRTDHQIKLRGFRIEPQEIEAQLRRQSGVAQALVLALPAPAGGQRLIAYVTPQSGSSADLNAEALRQALGTQLPDVMVPAAVVVLDHFPITANGKVNRQALPPPAQTGSAATDRRFRLDPLAAIVLETWEAVLGLKDLGADDNFFDCGGHSLAAARVVARLEKRLLTSLSPSDLFRYPTPRALTERLRHNHDRDPENPLVPLRPSGDGIPLFLIHGMFGDVFGFVDVVRQLPSPMPVWGVQMPRSLANGPRLDLESLACHYALCIQRQQPQGPYRLMAGSAGGWIAYAVAGALLEQGGQIDRLILLDTLANPPLRRRTRLRMLQAYGHQRLTRPRDDQRSTIDDLRFILGPRWRRQGLVERFGLGLHARRWLRDEDTDPTLAMVRRFRPPRLPLDIDLLTPHPPDHWSLRFWPDLIDGQLRQHQLFNAHADFFAAEHASTLAQRVDSLLRDTTRVLV